MAETNSLLNCRRSNPTTSSNLVLSAKSCKSPIYRTFSFLHPIHFFQKCQNPQTFRIPQPCIATNCDCTHTVRVPLFDICIYINMYRVPPPPVGLIYHPLYWRNLHLIARTRCIASPPPPAETMTKGDDDDKRRTFPPPRRRWQLCVAGYFADRGVGDMPGARARPQNRHPGGGGRPSRYTQRPISAKADTLSAKNDTPWCERQRAHPSAPSSQRSPIASLTLAPRSRNALK